MQKGDVLYSVCDEKIISVNIATSDSKRTKKPSTLDVPVAGDGWYVDVNYNRLKRPIPLRDGHTDEIARLSIEREVPFDEDGKPKEGHIFEIPYEAHKYMMGLVSTYNIASALDLPMLKEEDIVLAHQVEHIVAKYDTKEHKTLAIRMGMLETVMKHRILRQTKKCAVCDIDYIEFLFPVYCKPWVDASTSERLDINNLLLMCPLHRDMYEKGFITFNNKGLIKISSQMKFENFKSLSINLFTSINITKDQLDYIDWHSNHVFIK